MPCFYPRDVVRSKRVLDSTSRKPVVFFGKAREARLRLWKSTPGHVEFYQPDEFQVAGCKPKCVGCQQDYSRDWAIRCWHEASMHEENCFITLTFNDKWLPAGGLDHAYFQRFMKRFRKTVSASSRRISFYMAGELGSVSGRPHYHACIFGFDFPDRKFFTQREDVILYTSDMLSRLWSDPKSGESYGFCSVGDVTFASAAYIARYVSKKAVSNQGEYVRMSLKVPPKDGGKPGGIGKQWIVAYKNSVYPDDAVTLRDGGKCKPPKYYDKVFDLTDPVMSSTIKSVRKSRAAGNPDNSPERLRAREKVKQAQFKQLKRSL